MIDNGVDVSHQESLFGIVSSSQEKDLSCLLLPYLFSEVRRPEPAVKAGYIGVRLLKPSVFTTRDGQIRRDVETVPATCRPSRDNKDHDLWHHSDQTLALKNVQSSNLRGVDGFTCLTIGIFVAVFSTDPLIPA